MKQAMFAGLTAASVLAGGAQAQDWSGFYFGMSMVSGESAVDFTGLPSPYTGDDSAALGVFAGYNHVTGSNLVLGGELSYTDIDTAQFPPVSPYYGEGLLQARARVGYAAGNVMPYLALGLAQTTAGIVGGPSTSESGLSLGLGAEMMVGSNMSLRAEYTRAKFDAIGELVYFPPDFADLEYEAVSIGAAWHF